MIMTSKLQLILFLFYSCFTVRVLTRKRVICGISVYSCVILAWSILVRQQSVPYNVKEYYETADQKHKGGSIITRHQEPVYHIGFLKVRKAGSTTMQNLLFRFAIRHNLTVLLPRRQIHLLRKQQALPLQNSNHYDIFACHSFGNNEIFKLLPEDAVKIAIIRDPLERAISSAYYRRDVWHDEYLIRIPRDHFIDNLLLHPELYGSDFFSETRNTMGKDFGFEKILKNRTEVTVIESFLDTLRREYILVLILDRFYESLVLLKHKLKWNLQDILFIKTNTNQHIDVNLTDVLKSKFKETSFLDYVIYDTFYKILDEEINVQGSDFQDEVSHFIAVNEIMNEFCTNSFNDINILEVPISKWNPGFTIDREDCNLMQKNESSFVDYMRERHLAMKL